MDSSIRLEDLENLASDDVRLLFERIVPGDPSRGLVPFYHFKITTNLNQVVGHINFRVGNTNHVLNTAGHIGFEVLPEKRGHSYAYKACKALLPVVKKEYQKVILTADPLNTYSIAILERLGCRFLDKVAVPKEDPAYARGDREKVRYEWTL